MESGAIPSAQAAAINNTPQPAKIRRLMHVDPVNRVGWMAEARTRTGVEDYTYKRDSAHTGDLLDDRGDPIGKVFDVTPHKADAKTGMRLSGPNVFGKYKPVDGGEVTLGIFELDARKLKVSGTACSVAIRLVYTGTCVEDSHVFHMGSGWADHFTIVHGRGFLKFVTTPNNASGSWNNRVEVVSTFHDKDFEPGKAYTKEKCFSTSTGSSTSRARGWRRFPSLRCQPIGKTRGAGGSCDRTRPCRSVPVSSPSRSSTASSTPTQSVGTIPSETFIQTSREEDIT